MMYTMEVVATLGKECRIMESEQLGPSELQELAELAQRAARSAGSVILNKIDNVENVETKSSIRDLVTEVDREVEQQLRTFFEAETPDLGWIGEEGSYTEGLQPHRGRATWIVDPIDGTTNFVNGIPLCCVSIGLFSGDDGLVGAVYDPFRDELFSAALNHGARLNGTELRVQHEDELARAVLATGFADFEAGQTENIARMERAMVRAGKVRAFGTAALQLAWVAAGRLAGFWELALSPWDTAAGTVLVREAGGTVTDLTGRRYTLESPAIVATNGPLHQELLSLLGELP
jgi:myo-inositol-1(or 4)-monophosphatase